MTTDSTTSPPAGSGRSEGPPRGRWQVVDRQQAFAAEPFVRVTRESVKLPDGRLIDDYYRVDLGDFACVYPRASDGRILVLRQYKHGVGSSTLNFPGGHRRPGEDPGDCARRELLEETGFTAQAVTHLADVVIDGNKHCGIASLFVADGCVRKGEPDGGDLEETELLLLSEGELHAAAVRGELKVAAHLLLLSMATHPRMDHLNRST